MNAAMQSALLVGATGLVGRELLQQLLADERFASVTVLGRRSTGVSHAKLTEHVVNFDAPESWSELARGDVLFSALGTTLHAAGSQAAQYRVDHTYALAVARAARKNGTQVYVLVSSGGADPGSRFFYPRMKGELERDAAALGFPRPRFLRPGPLDGERQERRVAEKAMLRVLRPLAGVLPASARPIHASFVARAGITAALSPAPGAVVLDARELFRLGAPL